MWPSSGSNSFSIVETANNEVGTIEPVRELAELTHSKSRAVFHTDATQALGKLKAAPAEVA